MQGSKDHEQLIMRQRGCQIRIATDKVGYRHRRIPGSRTCRTVGNPEVLAGRTSGTVTRQVDGEPVG